MIPTFTPLRLSRTGLTGTTAIPVCRNRRGVYGAIIIDAREPEPFAYDREHVVMLSDWTDENPHSLLKKLKKQSDYYNFNKPTVGSFFPRREYQGLSATIADRKMWAEMKMNPTDLADVSGYTYTYLMNGQAPLKNWTGLFRPGEKIRLRFINGSAMTYFDIRIPRAENDGRGCRWPVCKPGYR